MLLRGTLRELVLLDKVKGNAAAIGAAHRSLEPFAPKLLLSPEDVSSTASCPGRDPPVFAAVTILRYATEEQDATEEQAMSTLFEVDADRTGFPLIKMAKLDFWVAWLPVTKIQFEHYLCDSKHVWCSLVPGSA